jgi:hypothetical protein
MRKRLLITSLREAVSFRARMWPVVATRLQGQHSSFRLRISSHTPFVLMNAAHGPFRKFSRRKWAFHFANFSLRSTWMNRHNSRQNCNLDELINQSESTRDFAPHLRNKASWESLLELWHVSLKPGIAMFGPGVLRFPKQIKVGLSRSRLAQWNNKRVWYDNVHF